LFRTLVLPLFESHFTTGGGSVLPEHRIDVQKIHNFMSSISIDHFRNICKGSFDVALQVLF